MLHTLAFASCRVHHPRDTHLFLADMLRVFHTIMVLLVTSEITCPPLATTNTFNPTFSVRRQSAPQDQIGQTQNWSPYLGSLSNTLLPATVIDDRNDLRKRTPTSTTSNPGRQTNEPAPAKGAPGKGRPIKKMSAFRVAQLPPSPNGMPTADQILYHIRRNLQHELGHEGGIVFSAGANRRLMRPWMGRWGLENAEHYMGFGI